MSTRHYRLLNAILLLALFAGSAWAYPRLPERIPVHFGLSGQPDRWEARSVTSWFLLPAIAGALALVLHATSVYGTRHPEVWNLPEKRRFLALHPPDQAPIIARMQRFMAMIGSFTTALLGAIQAGIFTVSIGRARELPVWGLAAVLASLVLIGVHAARMNREIGGMVREAHARAVG